MVPAGSRFTIPPRLNQGCPVKSIHRAARARQRWYRFLADNFSSDKRVWPRSSEVRDNFSSWASCVKDKHDPAELDHVESFFSRGGTRIGTPAHGRELRNAEPARQSRRL